jgi:capsular exopolysaccharide synthesis family protein
MESVQALAQDTGMDGPRRVPVAKESLARHRLIAADPLNSQREAYCLLQTEISRRLSEQEFDCLGITSPRRGRGKTLTAVNLAISFARDAKQGAILVDLNLRNPSVHRFLDLEPSAGVEGCLFGGVGLEAALFTPSIDRLLVLPARGGSQNVSQVLRSSNLRELLAETKSRYPGYVVIVDLPRLVTEAEARTYESLVDALILVVEDQVTPESDLKRAMAILDRSKLIGAVLNNSGNLR